MSGYAAIILAAGLGSRFGAAGGLGPTKLVASLRGKALVRHVAQAALASSARPVLVVTGHAADAVRTALDGLDVAFVHNQEFASGMASTVRRGIEALPLAIDGALVLLGDMPNVNSLIIDRLIAAAEVHPHVDAVIPTFDGQKGNPLLLMRSLFPVIACLEGDAGVRQLLRSGTIAALEIAVASEGVLLDVDAPHDLAALPTPPPR